ncbi:MAG: sulfurtransferase TusA family protein [Candidatus Limnocylindria bacterium]
MRLDVRGEVCPYPMLKTVEAMQKLGGREEVVVVTDHAPCLETIPPQAPRFGYSYSVEETGSPEWTIRLTPIGGGR